MGLIRYGRSAVIGIYPANQSGRMISYRSGTPGAPLIVPAPQNLTIEPHPGGWVLDWDTVAGASNYVVYRDGQQVAVSSNSLEVVSEPGTYHVTARIGAHESGPSNTVTAA